MVLCLVLSRIYVRCSVFSSVLQGFPLPPNNVNCCSQFLTMQHWKNTLSNAESANKAKGFITFKNPNVHISLHMNHVFLYEALQKLMFDIVFFVVVVFGYSEGPWLFEVSFCIYGKYIRECWKIACKLEKEIPKAATY